MIRPRQISALAVLLVCWHPRAATAATGTVTHAFLADRGGEAVAVVRAHVPRCGWELRGAETAVLRATLDGRYSQHVPLARGGEPGEYRIALGRVEPGRHVLQLARDDRASAPPCVPRITDVTVEVVDETHPDWAALSLAPVLHVRPGSLERFSDLPILAYVEVHPAPDGGAEYRYTVVFTHEDGGTPADRLMATWGRTTDIEFVYGVRLDAGGRVVAEEIQGPDHVLLPFTGRREARHALLWVTTDNNMVEAKGATQVRIVPAVERLDLGGRARETIMDLHPWTYRVMAFELAREDRIAADAPAGSGRIPPLRRFVFLETCPVLVNAALVLSVGVDDGAGGTTWVDVDRGVPDFRLTRSGCSRVAVPVPGDGRRITAWRVRAVERSRPDPEPAAATVRDLSLFVLDEHGEPTPLPGGWRGERPLTVGGPWVEMRLAH